MPSSYPPCPLMLITLSGVAKILRSLKPGKFAELHSLQNLVFKNFADDIAPFLSLVYQRSIDSGELPQNLLSANISASFKKGNRHVPKNYRSLTSILCRILDLNICSLNIPDIIKYTFKWISLESVITFL